MSAANNSLRSSEAETENRHGERSRTTTTTTHIPSPTHPPNASPSNQSHSS